MRVNTACNLDENICSSVAKSYYKLLAYKDEYEVARLHVSYLKDGIEKTFDNVGQIKFHLAPPLLSKKDKNGHLIKKEFGSWVFPILKILAKGKYLRGTIFDIFGYTSERKIERNLITEYEKDIELCLNNFSQDKINLILQRCLIPQEYKGFGHVKLKSIEDSKSNIISLMSKIIDNKNLENIKVA